MPRIRCLYGDCTFLDNKYCTATSVEIDPDLGCASYTPIDEAGVDADALADEWEDDEETYDGWDTEDIDLDDDEDFEEDEEDDW